MARIKSKKSKAFWWIANVGLFLCIVTAGFWLWQNNKQASSDMMGTTTPTDKQEQEVTTNPAPTPANQPTSPKTLTIGNPNAPVTITEYADFKCPLCNRFFRGAGAQIKQQYIDTGKVKIEFRTLPIIAEDSKPAAEAAYCANEQGKFVSFHDATFNYIWNNYYSKSFSQEYSTIFTQQTLADIAGSVGLDTTKFSNCLATHTYAGAVEADLQAAKTAGASSTPTVIIGGRKIVGAQSFSVYQPVIEAQIQ